MSELRTRVELVRDRLVTLFAAGDDAELWLLNGKRGLPALSELARRVLTKLEEGDQPMWSVLQGSEIAAGEWTHLVGVYDAQRHQILLYVDGVLQGTPVSRVAAGIPVTPWHAAGVLTVGRARWQSGPVDWYTGAVDDVHVFQGALTSAAVAALHASQSGQIEP